MTAAASSMCATGGNSARRTPFRTRGVCDPRISSRRRRTGRAGPAREHDQPLLGAQESCAGRACNRASEARWRRDPSSVVRPAAVTAPAAAEHRSGARAVWSGLGQARSDRGLAKSVRGAVIEEHRQLRCLRDRIEPDRVRDRLDLSQHRRLVGVCGHRQLDLGQVFGVDVALLARMPPVRPVAVDLRRGPLRGLSSRSTSASGRRFATFGQPFQFGKARCRPAHCPSSSEQLSLWELCPPLRSIESSLVPVR